MTEDERIQARRLHTRAADGEALTGEEEAALAAYYAETDGAGADRVRYEERLAGLEVRNVQLKALLERSEALAAYLHSVLSAAQIEREMLEREFRRIAA